MTAGAVGSFIGTPAELALIRMTSDGRCHVFHISISELTYECIL